jgi:hypothetical protein
MNALEMSDQKTTTYRSLRDDEVRQLVAQSCTAENWHDVQVAEPFLVDRVRAADFAGKVLVGPLAGDIQRAWTPKKPCGIYHARVHDCVIGSGVRIANVAGHLSGYQIGDGALIENVGVMETRRGARFGNGVEVAALNEAGGREVPLFNGLSSQFAYLVAVHRYRATLVKRLQEIAKREAEAAARDYGTIGEVATIVGVPKIINVNVGAAATIDSAQALANGTVLSARDAPAVIGDGVIAKDFIVAEGAHVTNGAILNHSFVGQGARVGNQFSAENCLFFANCEGFHGEAVSAFCGPYTVTHHKSTLLIGGMFSFYNAGSGTNQSNHRYKLGPTHEGKLERGCKTGSFAYMMWPCRVGPFSVVLGKHTRSFDTADLPFSHLEADEAGRCELIPGHYIATVGTLRDGAKWPKRDRRSGAVLRDVLCFDVFSPLTVGRMLRGAEMLSKLQEQVDRSTASVNVNGVEIKRVLLRMGAKRYTAAVERSLLEQIFQRLERQLTSGTKRLADVLDADTKAVFTQDWLDVGGQLMPQDRFEKVCGAIELGEIDTAVKLHHSFSEIRAMYEADVWAWSRQQIKKSLNMDPDSITPEVACDLVARYVEQQQKFLRLVLVDAEREYDEASRMGFGMDGDAKARDQDFTAVRGRLEDNSFVQQLHADIAALDKRGAAVRERLAAIKQQQSIH